VPVFVTRTAVPASPIGSSALRVRAERMLAALALPSAELSLVVCDDATIHQLNRQHRRKNKPTDVLAFALREGPALRGAEDLLGDVVISLETARRQAEVRGHPLWTEVTILLAHGLLHLLGHDHQTDEEERRMNARVDVLVAAAIARFPKKVVKGRKSSVKRQSARPAKKAARPAKKATRPAKMVARPAKKATRLAKAAGRSIRRR
jgi:probable rRNA maturation factor